MIIVCGLLGIWVIIRRLRKVWKWIFSKKKKGSEFNPLYDSPKNNPQENSKYEAKLEKRYSRYRKSIG